MKLRIKKKEKKKKVILLKIRIENIYPWFALFGYKCECACADVNIEISSSKKISLLCEIISHNRNFITETFTFFSTKTFTIPKLTFGPKTKSVFQRYRFSPSREGPLYFCDNRIHTWIEATERL